MICMSNFTSKSTSSILMKIFITARHNQNRSIRQFSGSSQIFWKRIFLKIQIGEISQMLFLRQSHKEFVGLVGHSLQPLSWKALMPFKVGNLFNFQSNRLWIVSLNFTNLYSRPPTSVKADSCLKLSAISKTIIQHRESHTLTKVKVRIAGKS